MIIFYYFYLRISVIFCIFAAKVGKNMIELTLNTPASEAKELASRVKKRRSLPV